MSNRMITTQQIMNARTRIMVQITLALTDIMLYEQLKMDNIWNKYDRVVLECEY